MTGWMQWRRPCSRWRERPKWSGDCGRERGLCGAVAGIASYPERAASMTAATLPKPVNPYLVLAVATLLPGVGHVLLGQQARGLGFAFFTLLFGFLTWHLSTPDISLIG